MLELEAPIAADLALTYQIPFRQNDILSIGLTTSLTEDTAAPASGQLHSAFIVMHAPLAF
jgi:hypothetical protein